ncbi:MAG: hypothetical protein RLZZ577_2 [Bacteroidota bacterium]|jgi:FkbM family methyltransferase
MKVIKKIIQKCIAVFIFLIKQLPNKVKVLLIEQFRFYEKIDYQKSELFINVTSKISLSRLNSVSKEPKTVKWIEDYFNRNDVFFDVGANVGAYSLIAASLGKEIKIYSFEPVPSTFNELCSNIKNNSFQRTIIPVNTCLSNLDGITTFTMSSLDAGAGLHKGLEGEDILNAPNDFEFSYYTSIYKLDTLIEKFNFPIPNHIKIDVDGHELGVLQGALNTLSNKFVKSIQIEVDENIQSGKKIVEFILDIGFKVQEKNLHPDTTNTYDYIFIK